MFCSQSDVIDYIKDNDIKFIRLAFCDPYGIQKNLSIMPTELPRAFETGIAVDASQIGGFKKELSGNEGKLLLYPDMLSFSVLPWRPSHGRVGRFFCNIKKRDGTSYEMDGRNLLRKAVVLAKNAGFDLVIGSECEFYLFMTDDLGNPTDIPYDNAGYLDIAPDDKGENVRREICLTLEEMGIIPESSHHSAGPGQNIVNFKFGDPLTSADNITTYKYVVRNISAKNGLYASFKPKPLNDKTGNNHKINIMLYKNGIYKAESDVCGLFAGGILTKAREMTAFLNPAEDSYVRLSSMIKAGTESIVLLQDDNDEIKNIVLNTPDPVINPYIVFTLLIAAGIEGIVKEPFSPDKYTNSISKLPNTYSEALKIASESHFVNEVLSPEIIEAYKSRGMTANL